MFDPEFDPYEELKVCKHNTQELAKGLNQMSHYLKELSHQHQQLTVVFAEIRSRLHRTEIELAALKSQLDSKIQ